LYIGKSILITLIFTTILLFIFSGLYSFFYKKLKNQTIAYIGTGGVFILFFFLVGYIISSQIDTFTNDISKI
jgi:predicted PurR-regulated permease PerM